MNTTQRSIRHERATETRSRRQAKGLYPTPAQDAAYRRLIARDGWKNVTAEDAALLSTHSWLTTRQREEFAAKAQQQ